MAKISNNDIRNINEDWGLDPRTNLPYSGRAVQKFIKDTFNNKIGDFYFNNSTAKIYQFKSKEDKELWLVNKDPDLVMSEVTFSGKVNKIEITNKTPGKPGNNIYFTTNSSTADIIIGFESFEKGIADIDWTELQEDFYVSVEIDKGSTGAYELVVEKRHIKNGKDLVFNIKDFLEIGENRVKIIAEGLDSKISNSYVITANLTSLYLKPSNFNWTTPFIEGTKYTLGGLEIGGNLYKEVVIKVTKEGYEKIYRDKTIGTQTFISSAYNYNYLEFPNAGTGVYNFEIWVDANGVESEHLNYNIICVKESEKFTAQLVSISNAPNSVINGTDNKLFEYCLYNKGESTASPSIKVSYVINTNPTLIVNEVLENTETQVAKDYIKPIEIDSEEALIYIDAVITLGNEQQAVINVDNSRNYPAVPNAIFYLNPSSRSNEQSNRDKIINSVDNSEIQAEFNNVIWVNGADGWTIDSNGRKCLKLPAYSTVNIKYKPLQSIDTTKGKSIEFLYKVSNVADYDDPIITICDDANNSEFKGIKIKPKNILLHSSNLKINDTLQDYNLEDESIVHVIVTIIYNYRTNYGNMAQIYVNGSKCRSFEFSNSDSWETVANINLGNNTSDSYIYKLKVYDRSFGKEDAIRNYLNCLASLEEKDKMNNFITSPIDDSFNINYDKCVRNNLNTMVIEMLNNKDIPSLSNPSSAKCNLTINIKNIINGELDAEMQELLTGKEILNQTIEGQGTTAMTYGRWNFRWKLDDLYGKRRITAKKNYASSMHSHKMGATRLFNILHKMVVGANEVNKNVAVIQYPVYGFQKVKLESGKYEYRFIGLYTIGADKGDKATFGFNDPNYKSTLMHLEGTDHTPKAVGFDYPWNKTKFSSAVEGMGAISATGDVIAAWEVGAAGKLEVDNISDEANVQTMLDNEFKPAYDVIYNNSPFILGVSESLEQINADISSWREKTTSDGKSYSLYEFYTNGVHDLYYYDETESKYKASGINLLNDLGITTSELSNKTANEINQYIINKRKNRFINNWGNYWNEDDAIFHYCFMLIFGATDNFKKNTYPYKFKTLENGGKWWWRSDDLDTIFDVNNQGLAVKLYSILIGDSTISGSVYRGDTSVLWTLITETKKVAIRTMVHKIFNAMETIATELGLGKNSIDKLIECVRYYFWRFAQEYFPQSAYNSDSEWTYEDIWIQPSLWKEVNPLSQSLGRHYEAEKDWVKMRMLFLSSYYNYGPFTNVKDGFSDTSTGQIAYGGAGSHTFKITPAVDLNPTIIRGQTEYFSANDRIKAGDTAIINIGSSSGADTRIYIQGVDWISDIGDLSTLEVTADNAKLNISSKRLKYLIIGNEDANSVTSNVKEISFGDCPSMIKVDARNLKELTGDIDLSYLTRLQTALFGGTKITSIKLPVGSRISHMQVPNTLTSIFLKENNFLELFEYETLDNLETINIQYCDVINGWDILKESYNAPNSKLKNIKLLGINYNGTGDDLSILANLATAVNEDGTRKYNGINNSENYDNNILPVIEGSFTVDHAYKDHVDILKKYYPQINVNVTGGYYVRFEDPAFNQIVADTYGDGVGVTQEQLDKVTSLFSLYRNSTVETLNDLYKFRNLDTIPNNAIKAMSKLEKLNIPNTVVTFGVTAVNNLPNIKEFIISSDSVDSLKSFLGEMSLKYLVIPNSVKSCSFSSHTGITNLFLGNGLESVSDSQYNNNGISNVYIDNLKHWFELSVNQHFMRNITLYLGQIEAVRDTNKGNQIDHYNWDKLEGTGDYADKGEYEGKRQLVTTEMVNEALEEVTEIKANACVNMTQLEGELVIPSNITKIGNNAFSYCNFDSFIISDGVQSIDGNAFYNARKTESTFDLVVPKSVKKIGTTAFAALGLNSITLYTSEITLTGANPFRFNNPSNVYIDDYVALFKTEYSYNFAEDNKFNLYVNNELLTEVSIPYIGVSTLNGSLANSSVNKFKIGEGYLTTVGNAFSNCSPILIDLPSTITNLGRLLFNAKGTPVIIIRSAEPPSISFGAGTPLVIYVPDDSVEAYKIAEGWSAYAGRIKPLSEIEGFNLLPQSGNVSKVTSLKATYDAVEVTPEYTVDGTVATIEDGVLTFSEVGEVTVTATYNGESVSRTYSWDGSIIPIENGVALQNSGTTAINSTMSTVGFVPCKPSTQIKWGVTGGTLGTLCEYKEDGAFVDYWGSNQNPRTINVSANSTKVKASFSTAHLDNAYIYDVTNSVYLWKGDNVES